MKTEKSAPVRLRFAPGGEGLHERLRRFFIGLRAAWEGAEK